MGIGVKVFKIKEALQLGTLGRDKKPKQILIYKDGKVGYSNIDTIPKQGSGNLMTSGGIYNAIKDLTSSATSMIGGGSASLQNLQGVTTIGNITNRGLILRNSAGDKEYLLEVDTNGHLVFTGGLNQNAHFSGDVTAYSAASPPPASWWDDLPVASASVHGGIKVGDRLTMTAGVLSADVQGSVSVWGDIGGTLSNQTDLQSALDAKEDTFSKNTAFNKDFGTLVTQVAYGNHNHSGVYEPVFSKNTAFNKNFGTSTGQVSEGDHTHTLQAVTATGASTTIDTSFGSSTNKLNTNYSDPSGYSRIQFTNVGVAGNNFIISYGSDGSPAYGLALKAQNALGNISLHTNSAERVRIDPDGNVGIGIFTSIGAKMDVVGNIFASGTVNSATAADQIQLNGMGLLANRSAGIYITNSHASGIIYFRSHGGVHSASSWDCKIEANSDFKSKGDVIAYAT